MDRPASDRRDAVVFSSIETGLIVRGDNLWRNNQQDPRP
jgi:hypothetical protein